jgi:hypothetical protein
MRQTIEESLSKMTDADLKAMVAYDVGRVPAVDDAAAEPTGQARIADELALVVAHAAMAQAFDQVPTAVHLRAGLRPSPSLGTPRFRTTTRERSSPTSSLSRR